MNEAISSNSNFSSITKENELVIWSDDAPDDVIKNKKRRKSEVRTCKTCNQKHQKCDGMEPCGRCTKYNVNCEYPAQRNKPGPTAGKMKQLEDAVRSLQNELAQAKELNLLFQQMMGLQLGSPNALSSTVKSLFTNVAFPYVTLHSNPFSMIQDYLNLYNDYFLLFGIQPPQTDLDSFLNGTAPYNIQLILNTILLNAAFTGGSKIHAQEFHQKAKLILHDHGNDIDSYVAASHYLLSFYVWMVDSAEVSSNHLALAMNISRVLLSKSHNQEEDDLLACTYMCSSINYADMYADWNDVEKTYDKLLEVSENFSYSNKQLIDYYVCFIKSWSKLLIEKSREAAIELLEVVGSKEDILANCGPRFQQEIACWILSAKAVSYYYLGDISEAVRYADQTLDILQAASCWSHIVLEAVNIAAQLHFETEHYERFEQDKLFLTTKVAKIFPLANTLKQVLDDPLRDYSVMKGYRLSNLYLNTKVSTSVPSILLDNWLTLTSSDFTASSPRTEELIDYDFLLDNKNIL